MPALVLSYFENNFRGLCKSEMRGGKGKVGVPKFFMRLPLDGRNGFVGRCFH